jgi:hypothetical protein
VNLPTIALLAGFAILTLWGVFAPRGQWRALAGWARRDSYASEPGPVSVGIHRFVAIVATVGLGFAGYTLVQDYWNSQPKPAAPPPALIQMWGSPAPQVVNRVVTPLTSAPGGLVAQPIVRYQVMDGARRMPAYLFDLQVWSRPGAHSGDGYVGVDPSPGLTALDSGSIVLQVRGDKNCIPQAVVALESSKSVAFGVFYGRPNAKPGAAPAITSDCKPAVAGAGAVSVLIPVTLSDAVDSRSVINIDGSAIPNTVDLIDHTKL